MGANNEPAQKVYFNYGEDFVLNPNSLHYMEGDKIAGKVSFKLTNYLPVSSIVMVLEGFENVTWKKREAYTVTTGRNIRNGRRGASTS
mmetsp:Transcript_35397/g.40914  ORF Transcript_35397/g.40914 Transcript_35397/m.40914 type:complete len:88 (+) Transcript_35397:36-299(+)